MTHYFGKGKMYNIHEIMMGMLDFRGTSKHSNLLNIKYDKKILG